MRLQGRTLFQCYRLSLAVRLGGGVAFMLRRRTAPSSVYPPSKSTTGTDEGVMLVVYDGLDAEEIVEH